MSKFERFSLTKGNSLIEVNILEDGRIEMVACCLKTDSWEDYLAFKSQAAEADACGEKKDSRRYLRAALVSLFSHLDGVLNEIYDAHEIPIIDEGNSIFVRIKNIEYEAKERGEIIPRFRCRLGKYLRDIVAHPGIEKIYRERDKNTTLTDITLYEFLDLTTLKQIEFDITKWLDTICSVFKVSRFPAENELNQLVDEMLRTHLDGIVEQKSKTERLIDLNAFKIVIIDTTRDIVDEAPGSP